MKMAESKTFDGILSFYEQYIQLSELLRTGWVVRKVPAERLESVADHTLQVLMLAHTFVREFEIPNIDLNELTIMCLFHDLAETIIGDIPVIYVNTEEEKKQKHAAEEKALKALLSSLSEKTADEYYQAWLAFEKRETPTAKLAYQVDKIDAIMRAKHYSNIYKRPELFEEFYETDVRKNIFVDGPLKPFFEYLKEEKREDDR